MVINLSSQLLVVDTNVVVKWHLAEQFGDEAEQLLEAATSFQVRLIAPSTILPEFFNALWQQFRRGVLDEADLWSAWNDVHDLAPVMLFEPGELISRAVEIVAETKIIVYDGLFIALAEMFDTQVVTADFALVRSLSQSRLSSLALPITALDSSLR